MWFFIVSVLYHTGVKGIIRAYDQMTANDSEAVEPVPEFEYDQTMSW